jgi:hypothetical protein
VVEFKLPPMLCNPKIILTESGPVILANSGIETPSIKINLIGEIKVEEKCSEVESHEEALKRYEKGYEQVCEEIICAQDVCETLTKKIQAQLQVKINLSLRIEEIKKILGKAE